MNVKVVFLGKLATLFGHERIIEAAPDDTVADIRAHFLAEDEDGVLSYRATKPVVDQRVVDWDTKVGAADEVAFLPPFSGG